jgi:hypothetical protein
MRPAFPGEALAADADAVAHGLSVRQRRIEIALFVSTVMVPGRSLVGSCTISRVVVGYSRASRASS